MKPPLITLLSRHQFLLSSVIIGLFIAGGALFTTNYYSTQIATVVAGNCYLQTEVDAKIQEKASLASQIIDAQKDIDTANANIIQNWSSLTSVKGEIEKITPNIISDYAIQTEKTKVDTLYAQLSSRGDLDLLNTQVQTAKAKADSAKKTYEILNSQVRSAKYDVDKQLIAVNVAKKSSNTAKGRAAYSTQQTRYNALLATYNSLNNQYKTAPATYQSNIAQYNTLNTQYTTALALYKSKYTSTASTGEIQKQYDELASVYRKLVSDNDVIKAKIATLNSDKAKYEAKDKELNQKVETFTVALKQRTQYVLDAAKAIDIYKANICPAEEVMCSDNLDNDRDGRQDCADTDCAEEVVCQAGTDTTASQITLYPSNGAKKVSAGISQLKITFPYVINYHGGVVEIKDQNGNEVSVGGVSAEGNTVTINISGYLQDSTSYSVNVNLDLGEQWSGSWGFVTAGVNGNDAGGGALDTSSNLDGTAGTDGNADGINADDVGDCDTVGDSSPEEIKRVDIEEELYRRTESRTELENQEGWLQQYINAVKSEDPSADQSADESSLASIRDQIKSVKNEIEILSHISVPSSWKPRTDVPALRSTESCLKKEDQIIDPPKKLDV